MAEGEINIWEAMAATQKDRGGEFDLTPLMTGSETEDINETPGLGNIFPPPGKTPFF